MSDLKEEEEKQKKLFLQVERKIAQIYMDYGIYLGVKTNTNLK